MLSVSEAKEYLRIDNDEEDRIIASLIIAATEYVQNVMRRSFDEFDKVPESVNQAVLLTVATMYENRQGGKDGLDMGGLTDIIRRMTFAYRKEFF
jgi:uncharacterized phage protein (predicted DNA packaging)